LGLGTWGLSVFYSWQFVLIRGFKSLKARFRHHLSIRNTQYVVSQVALCYNHGIIMKTLNEIKAILEVQKPYLAEKYGVTEIGVFGSYVRGEQGPDSDVDILIELTPPPRISLLDLVELEYYLSDLLGVKVETAIKKNLKPRLKPYILQEVVRV